MMSDDRNHNDLHGEEEKLLFMDDVLPPVDENTMGYFMRYCSMSRDMMMMALVGLADAEKREKGPRLSSYWAAVRAYIQNGDLRSAVDQSDRILKARG